MTTAPAVRSGFAAIARAPALALAEIAWRWTYGLATLVILTWAFFRFLQSIPVSDADLLMLNSMLPPLMAQAVENIFRGSGVKLARLAAIILPSLILLWIPAATAGRAATLRALLPGTGKSWRALLGLHILRAALWLATTVATIGALILAGYAAVWWGTPDDPTLFIVVFLLLGTIITLISSTIWWYLALAPLFAWRDSLPTFPAIVAAQRFARRNAGAVSGVSLVFGVIRLAALLFATLAGLFALPLLAEPLRAVGITLVVLITLGYFAFADSLYAARLAAYAAIVEAEHAPAYDPPSTSDLPRPRVALEV